MKQFHNNFWMTFSVYVYQRLSFILPAEFRLNYGRDMSQVFRDCCRRAYLRKGNVGVLGELVAGTFDLLINAVRAGITALIDDNRRMLVLLMISMVGTGAGAYAAFADLQGNEWPGPIFMVVIFTFALGFLRPSSSWLTGLLIGLMFPVMHFVARNKGWEIAHPTGGSSPYWASLALIPALIGSTFGAVSRSVLDHIVSRFEQ